MARVIPLECVLDYGEIIYLTRLDEVDNPVNTNAMSCQSSKSTGCATSQPQCMVDKTPKYENQVIGRKSKIIRKDKRRKVKYL